MPHTPGPWKVRKSEYGCVLVDADNGDSIATVFTLGETHEEQLANARLIAAAPMLLKAAKTLLETSCNCEEGYTCEMCRLRAAMRSAQARLEKIDESISRQDDLRVMYCITEAWASTDMTIEERDAIKLRLSYRLLEAEAWRAVREDWEELRDVEDEIQYQIARLDAMKEGKSDGN